MKLAASGLGSARMFTRARVLLKADQSINGPDWPDDRISEALDITIQTIERIRKQFVIELRVLLGQCLDRRISDKLTLKHEVASWASQRNVLHARVDWRFSTEDARIKYKKTLSNIIILT